jgi:uracil-DNA glycosylase family 4
LQLTGAYISAVVRCAPPANKPLPEERDNCLPYLEREMRLLHNVKVIVCLGKFAYDGIARVTGLKNRPAFGHGVETRLADGRWVICSFHPSQQNTFTRRLTVPMFDAIFARARALARAGQ